MKKNLILFLIIPLFSFAKFYKGNINFIDGSQRSCFIELPEYSDDTKLKFKSEEKGKAEKIEIDLIKSFEITNNRNEITKYVTILLANPKPFTNVKFNLDDKRSWAKIIKEGKITLYSTQEAYNHGSGTGGGTSYYIQKGNEKYAYFIADGESGGLSVNMNGFSVFKSCVKSIFENECPKLYELLKKDDFKKKGVTMIIDLYEQNCN